MRDACAQRTIRNLYLSLSHKSWTHFWSIGGIGNSSSSIYALWSLPIPITSISGLGNHVDGEYRQAVDFNQSEAVYQCCRIDIAPAASTMHDATRDTRRMISNERTIIPEKLYAHWISRIAYRVVHRAGLLEPIHGFRLVEILRSCYLVFHCVWTFIHSFSPAFPSPHTICVSGCAAE